MTLLTIAKSVSVRVMAQNIISAAGNADPRILQIVELINEEGQELANRYTWQALTNEANFTTVATESQGLMATITGPDFAFMVNETMWNRSQRRPVFGPKSDAEWQQLKAQFMQGPWIQYRIRGNQLMFLPVPAAGQSVYFEWVSNYWCTDTTGVTGKTAMTVDTDISKLDERLLVLGGIWRFKRANNLAYDEDYKKYSDAIDAAMARDGSKPRLNLGGEQTDILPAVIVPAGNWGL